jgi:CHAT domain-containing protein
LAGAPWLEPGSRGEESKAVLRSASRAASTALKERVTAETLRDDAVVKLLTGEVDLAVEGLTKAADLDPSSAVVWSDLSAAHLYRSAVGSDPYELVVALAAGHRAVLRDPTFSPGRFNRALALERLSLHSLTAAEWRLISKRETDPLWAREAWSHTSALARQAAARDWQRDLEAVREAVRQSQPERVRSIVAGSPQRFREHLEEELLGEWAKAQKGHRELAASRALEVARAISEPLGVIGNDRMAADTIVQIERTQRSDALRQLVAGLLAYWEGLDFARKNSFSRALLRFQKARELLAREGNPFAYWASYQIAFCRYQIADYQLARAQVLAITSDPASAHYQVLRGRSLLLAGLVDGIKGRHTSSIAFFEAAEMAFRRSKEGAYAAKVNAILATELDVLGQREEAWRRLYLALTEPATFDKPESRYFFYEHASWMALKEDETEIALWFQDESVENARAMEQPRALVSTLRQRSKLLAALGRKKESESDLAEARDALQKISDLSQRRMLEGDLLLVESELAGSAAPEQAVARLDEAIQIFRETSYHYRLVDALSRRALANKALGRYDDAERDLAAAIAELEQQRETVDSAEYRISYLDRVKDIFDTMIELQIEQRQRPAEALRVNEQAKARVLWDWMMARPTSEPTLPHLRPAGTESFDLGAIQRGIPDGTAVVEYAILPRRIVVWILHGRGDLRWENWEIDSADVDDLVQRLRRAVLENRSAELQLLSDKAYDLLIRPVERHLAPGERLVLIPDGPLHALPFSVLRNSKTGRYLFQDRVLAMAPSIRVYAESRRRDKVLARDSRNILVVAAPEFDRGIDPTLLPLKAGETEASIGEIFPGRVLRGREATQKAFLQAAPDFELVHFGGHSVVNVEHPLLSQMLFAKDSTDPSQGVLYSGEVLRQSFPRTRLVVLASCGTALGKVSRTEGVENLARPFLAAGVPTVVASLWNVEDQVTAELFVRFYRNLKQGLDVAAALQAAQIQSFDHGLSPRVWAAFETIGGGVDDGRSNHRPGAAGTTPLPTSERRKVP